MRLTAILLLTACLQVSASGFSQAITFSGKAVPLETVFQAVTKQTGYFVAFKSSHVNEARPVTISADNLALNDFLSLALKNQALDFTITGKTIFIRSKAPVAPTIGLVNAPQPITGMVQGPDGRPLGGVNVIIKGSSKGTTSTSEGAFVIDAEIGDKLIISAIGYASQEIPVTGDRHILVSMIISSSPLDQVQIIGYGSTSRRFSVGSVATVDAATIERQPVNNVLLALQGQAPGMAVSASSGVPGSRVQIQIRGQNSLMSTASGLKPYDQPFFIIDGVPFAPQNNNVNQLGGLSGGNFYTGGFSQVGGLSPFNTINPDDIESISILKDADATSIYGTQGSNGVILITTKKGRAGKTSFNLNANTGFNSAIRTLDLLTTEQYLQSRRDGFEADGITPQVDFPWSPGWAPDLLLFDQNKYTDWYSLVHGKSANSVDVHASLSGGSPNNTFMLSAGYNRAGVNFPGSYATESFTVHSNLHHSSRNDKLTADFTTDFGYTFNNSPTGASASAAFLAPNTPDLIDESGNLVWTYKGIDMSNSQFYGYLKTLVDMNNYNFNNSLRLSYKILPGLSIGGSIGYNLNTTVEHSENPAVAQNPVWAYRSANFGNGRTQTFIAEPQIEYNYASGKNMLNVLVGGTYKRNSNNSMLVYAGGYANDKFLGSVGGAPDQTVYDMSELYKYTAGFARVRFIRDQRYILSLTGRRDGSSNFGPNNRFGNFGSVGAGWIISEENFVKQYSSVISYAKISANYGTSGSDGIAPYKYQAFWQPSTFIPTFEGIQPTDPLNLYNPNYSWALKKSLNTSLELGFFRDRLLLNATFYLNRQGNQLGAVPLPNQVGITSVIENLDATIQNKGWEFSVNSTNIKTNDFTWTMNFNISFNRNKLVSFPNLEASPYRSQYVIGKPTSTAYVYLFKGLNDTTGLFEFYDRDGKVTNTPVYGGAFRNGDQMPVADAEVNYMGGIGNTFTYKNFNLHFFIQFTNQSSFNFLGALYGGNNLPGRSTKNFPVEGLDYWRKPGDRTSMQKLTTDYFTLASRTASSFFASTGAYTESMWMKFKTLSLSYDLPKQLLSRMNMQGLRVFTTVQNLFTISGFDVIDPEQGTDFTVMPLQRTVAMGLNFNF